MSKNIKKLILVSIGILVTTIFGIIILVNRNSPNSPDLLLECNRQYESSKDSMSDKERTYIRDICYTNIARKSQVSDSCNQIQDKKLKDVCLLQTYYWNKTVEFCESDDRRDICLHTLSIKNQDKNICSKIKNDSIRNVCNAE